MRYVKRLIFGISLIALYFIAREFISLYVDIKNLHPIAGIVFLVLLATAFIFFVILPVSRILLLPTFDGPTTDRGKEERLIKKRIKLFRKNSYLKNFGFDFSEINDDVASYNKIIDVLNKEADRIKKKYILNMFAGSALAQNGFIDMFLIMSLNIRVTKEIFLLYGGRATYKDILTIGKHVYYSMAIGGSEGAEYVLEELLAKTSGNLIQSIPFLGKLMSSVTDGFVNAILLTRVAMITENYCKMTYIKSKKDLFPRLKAITSTTSGLLKPLISKIGRGIKKLTVDKGVDKIKQGVTGIYKTIKSHKGEFEDADETNAVMEDDIEPLEEDEE